MPLIVPPQLRAERLLIDGSLLDNLPLAPMTFTGEGPVLAVDIKGGDGRAAGPTAPAPARASIAAVSERRVRLPSLTATMYRIALLSSANTAEAARLHADFTVEVRVPAVGLFEFHQIDEARAAGRRAAAEALEDRARVAAADASKLEPRRPAHGRTRVTASRYSRFSRISFARDHCSAGTAR